MKLDFDERPSNLTISGYSEDGINVAGQLINKPFIVCGKEIYLDRLPASCRDILPEHIDELIELGQNIILLGTGPTRHLLSDSILGPAFAAGIGVEVMTTPAACRSYNVLTGENRAVVGAFFVT